MMVPPATFNVGCADPVQEALAPAIKGLADAQYELNAAAELADARCRMNGTIICATCGSRRASTRRF